jgi:hypothetical protein
MTTLEDHVRSRLEMWLETMDLYLSARAAGEFDPRESEILSAAAKLRDGVWAQWLRDQLDIEHIRRACDEVKEHLDSGDIVAAYRAHEYWERERDLVQQIIDGAHIRGNRKAKSDRRRGHEVRYGTDEEKAERRVMYATEYYAERKAGTKKPALIVAGRHGVSEGTIWRALRHVREPKS